tara:strand:- start:3845 stop:4219 length:375 start_codon:yes stop_codon:yes gene_type:complete
MFEFSKKHKLCSEKSIKRMFENGSAITEPPFRAVWIVESNQDGVYAKTLISVSKKQFKFAKDRNLLKRRIREIYRLNNKNLENRLSTKKIQINLAILYNHDKILESSFMTKKINLLLSRLITNL